MKPTLFRINGSAFECLDVSKCTPRGFSGALLLDPSPRSYTPFPTSNRLTKTVFKDIKTRHVKKSSPSSVASFTDVGNALDEDEDDPFVRPTPNRKRLRRGSGLVGLEPAATPAHRCLTCSLTLAEGENSCRICYQKRSCSPGPIVVHIDDDDGESPASEWTCSACTYLNSASDHSCEMCGGMPKNGTDTNVLSRLRKISEPFSCRIATQALQGNYSNSNGASDYVDNNSAPIKRNRSFEFREMKQHDDTDWMNDGDGISIVEDEPLLLSDSGDDNDVENISDFEDDFNEENIGRSFSAFSGYSDYNITVQSSYRDDPDLSHVVSVNDLNKTPGATAIDFSKFILGKVGSKPANLKYEARKESRLKKKKTNTYAKKKGYGGGAYRKREKAK